MSNKLTFVEWEIKQDEACNKSFIRCCEKSCTGCEHDSNAINAWNFAQAQEQKEYKLLEAEHGILLTQFSKVDIERLRLEKEAQAKQAMYDDKYAELHKANVVLMDERDIIRKENDSLWVENEDLTRKLENPAQKIINKQAHDNAIRKLNEANERIVEFEDIKKSHLKIQSELKKKVEELEKTVSSQTEIIYKLENECSFTYKCPVNSNLQKENESLKKKLEKAEEVIKFYANQENWYSHGKDSTIKRRIDLNDGEEFLNYEYGGKRARAYLKENV